MAGRSSDEMMWGWQSTIKNSAERGKHVLETDFHSDVTFRVGPKDAEPVDIKAHKFVLATGSTVFETMFYGNLPETRSVIPITDIDAESFRNLLRYLYYQQTGPFDDTTAFPTLYAAKKYGLPILKDACDRHIRANVNVQNCLAWLVEAEIYDEPKLAELFLSTIDSRASVFFGSADFLELGNGTLQAILARDSLKVREVDVYDAAVRWARHHCAEKEMDDTGENLRAALEKMLYLIRFPIMTSQDVALGPVKLGMLLDEEIEQLRCWFDYKTLPGRFIITRRQISAELNIVRFGGKQDGWAYTAGRPNEIRLCIASTTDKTNRNVDSASINLVAVGFYLSSVTPSVPTPTYQQCEQYCHSCGALSMVSRALPTPQLPSPAITLRVYIEEGASQTELTQFHQNLYLPCYGQTGDRVLKIGLNKPVPLELYRHYTISADITGIQRSYYGTEGKSSVTMPTPSGDLNVTVQFSEGNQSSNVYSGGQPGITSVAQGQMPEFYFSVVG